MEAFHIDRAECIGTDNTVRHRAEDGSVVVHRNFLRTGPMTIGLTSGASTPDRYDVLHTRTPTEQRLLLTLTQLHLRK